jgi:hypothetical protein
MPSRYPAEVRRQVVELARSGTTVAQLAGPCRQIEIAPSALVEHATALGACDRHSDLPGDRRSHRERLGLQRLREHAVCAFADCPRDRHETTSVHLRHKIFHRAHRISQLLTIHRVA